MTDRVTKVILRGEVGDLIGKLKATQSAVKATASSMTDSSKESKAWRQNLTAVGTTAGKFGLVAAAGVGLAIRAFANFDQAMSNVAATGDDARQSLDALRDAAIKTGARTQYSATEAAGAIETLAKAGVSAKDILAGGLDGALALAAAGSLDVASAAEIAATAMNQFKLAGSDVPHIADLLAAAAGKAMGDVTDMGAAFKFVGPVAAQLGVSMEETAGTIALLAQNGVLGEQAGTSLRGMLTALTSPSKIAASTMKELGISMYDAQGQFIGLDGLAGQLHDRLGGLGEAERNAALGRIFGNEQITAARILYAGGADDVRKWTKAVNDDGYAAETAARKMDNLKGDLEQLRGSLETALIGTGSSANGPLRELLQLLTKLTNVYNDLPGPIKTTVLAGAGLTAALGGTVFVASRAIDSYSRLKTNMVGLGGSFDQVNKKALATRVGIGAVGIGLASLSGPAHKANESLGQLTDVASAAALGFAVGGPWGAAIGGSIALISSLGHSSKVSASDIASLTGTLDEQTGAITDNTAQWVAKNLADSKSARALQAQGVSLATVTDAVLGNKDAMDKVTAASEKYGVASDQVLDPIKALRDGILDGKQANVDAKGAIDDSVEAQNALGTSAEDAATDVDKLTKALDDLLDPILNQEDASNAWKDSIASLTADLRENGTTLDDNSVKGRANQDAIRERVRALQDSVQADADAGVGQEQLSAKLLQGAKDILAAGAAANISEKDMSGYLKQLGLTPEQVKTYIKLYGVDAAQTALKNFRSSLAAISGRSWFVDVILRKSGLLATGGAIGLGYAAGGSVVGAGTGTSDSIPATGPGGARYALSNGEHVLTAQEVNMVGGQAAVYAMRAAIRNRQFAFAGGGAVGGGSPSTLALDGLSGELTITNWTTGEGRFRLIAAHEVARHDLQGSMTARLG